MSNVKLVVQGPDPGLVRDSIESILGQTQLCTLGTVGANGAPHVNTCFFAWDEDLTLVVLTPPTTVHALNWSRLPEVAVNIFDTNQRAGEQLRGLQGMATCQLADSGAELETAFAIYAQRYPGTKDAAPTPQRLLEVFESRLFLLTVQRIKVFDEPAFGKEVWVEATVSR